MGERGLNGYPVTITQILKSSSLIGGAQGINLLLGMVRVKFAAVLIGPVGVGLLGNYAAIQGLVGTVAGLGIQSSAVRDVAEAVGKGDQQAIGRTILALRRICWLTGLPAFHRSGHSTGEVAPSDGILYRACAPPRPVHPGTGDCRTGSGAG